jgi:hypothetical protein
MNAKTDIETLLRRCYDAFNRRDLEGALALIHPDVTWPNGWEGGWVHGRDHVREYWQHQWAALDPHLEPTRSRVRYCSRSCSTPVRSRSVRAISLRHDQRGRGVRCEPGSALRRPQRDGS